jgi:hypothetical protein
VTSTIERYSINEIAKYRTPLQTERLRHCQNALTEPTTFLTMVAKRANISLTICNPASPKLWATPPDSKNF